MSHTRQMEHAAYLGCLDNSGRASIAHMVDDGSSSLVNLKTDLRSDVLDSCPTVAACRDQDVAARVNKVDEILSLDTSSEFCGAWHIRR